MPWQYLKQVQGSWNTTEQHKWSWYRVTPSPIATHTMLIILLQFTSFMWWCRKNLTPWNTLKTELKLLQGIHHYLWDDVFVIKPWSYISISRHTGMCDMWDLWHVGSSQSKDQTCVSCTGRCRIQLFCQPRSEDIINQQKNTSQINVLSASFWMHREQYNIQYNMQQVSSSSLRTTEPRTQG